ncbi:unnamed protein product [Cuscuta campestris]|uniref:DUF223 domain-containing protein n=1 Tax=Cuscuta campestris TaxID=132261 RepID=A0A484N4N7_9ASTE|nr:unnamed protein product [Cuscuta campestris]
MTIHPLSKITPSSECWRIMVRVVRLYTLPAYNDERTTNSIEMVFMDEHGTTMHATVRRSLVGTFEKRIKEGYVYVFAYFGIGISSGNYRTSRHEFWLNFQPRTTVTACSLDEDFLKLTKAATIDTLKDCIEDGEYAVYGTIKDVDSDWCITVCRCGSEVVPRGGSYYCNECKRRVMNLIPRYRIKTRVVDTTDSATFVVLESVACLLLHKSCSEMLKYSENLPSGDIKPDVFNKLLIDKSYLFKVDVRRSQFNDFDPTYNVIDICFDERTISRFKERHATFFSVQNLIEDFVQSKDNQFERLGDDITDSNIGKRIEEFESDYADDHEPSKKMKTIKIEKI